MARYRTRPLERKISENEAINLFSKAYTTHKFLPKPKVSIEDVYNSLSESRRKEIIDSYLIRKPRYKA